MCSANRTRRQLSTTYWRQNCTIAPGCVAVCSEVSRRFEIALEKVADVFPSQGGNDETGFGVEFDSGGALYATSLVTAVD